MRVRGQILEHQFAAGRHWQKLWEQAQVGSMRSLDPSQLHVDGSAPAPEIVALRRRKAIAELGRARNRLGQSGNMLVSCVLVRGLPLRVIAEASGFTTERERSYLGLRFRECLDELAEVFGYA
jgi:hypothetical protein